MDKMKVKVNSMDDFTRIKCPNCNHNYYWYLVEDVEGLAIVCKTCDYVFGGMINEGS